MLRPRPARWFEILAARDDATLVLEALARTGAVELEAREGAVLSTEMAELAPLLAQYFELAARLRAYWPASADCRPSALPQPPLPTLQRCLATIRAWAVPAEPAIRALQRGDAETAELQRWQQVLQVLAARSLDPALLAGAGPLVQLRLVALPTGSEAEQVFTPGAPGLGILASLFDIQGQPHALVAASPAALQALAQGVSALKGSLHEVPRWLQEDHGANQAEVQQRLARLGSERAAQQAALAALNAEHDLPRALGDANRLQWVMHNVHALEAGRLFCWITGWSSDAGGTRLPEALLQCPGRALLRYAAPPAGVRAPLLLTNPPWARPFEIFSRALGMPSSAEADPTPLLAIVVPLMFGYMFGDLGQGLLLAAAGWWLRDRFVVARLLMVGGLAAALFGLMFGSLFGLHHVIPALWLNPLDAPLVVLLVPLAGGAVLLTLGLLINAAEAHWRGELRRWLLGDAALIAVYLGLVLAPLDARTLAIAAAGALWFCTGHAVFDRRPAAAPAALGELVEKALQILINTLSFARVGAFALAHAGLSSAITALMDAAGSGAGKAAVLIVGNLGVIVLEAMVVSIQTTRLVLFEFFTRFLQAKGRAFRPLPAPPFIDQEKTMNKPSGLQLAAAVMTVLTGLSASVLLFATPSASAAAAASAPDTGGAIAMVANSGWGLIGAALATAMSSLAAGYAVAKVGTAAVGALAEKPELFGRLLIFVGLAEGIAIYGLIVSILILNRLG